MPAADEARAAKDVSLDATEPSVAEEPPAALGGQEGGSTILNEPRPIPEATIGETEEAFTNMPFAVEFCSGTAGLTAQLPCRIVWSRPRREGRIESTRAKTGP